MEPRHIFLFFFVMLFFSSCSEDTNQDHCDGTARTVFLEENGLLVIEAENTDINGEWMLANDTSGFTGRGYIQWHGENLFSKPGQDINSYKIQINNPGIYRFQWRSHINEGNNQTESNDAWLRIPDAEDFYAEKNGNRLYPKGSGKSPNPNGAGSNGWFKVYMNQKQRWSWQARTSDHDAHNIFVLFDNQGIYTVEIAGRSRGFAIDRMVFYQNMIATDSATNIEVPESSFDCQ